jgi:hypothetical protein
MIRALALSLAALPAPAAADDLSPLRAALVTAIRPCWNHAGLTPAARRVTVTWALRLSPAGVPDPASLTLREAAGGDPAAQAEAAEAARRAILRCGAAGLPVPAGSFDRWRELEITFNPDGEPIG